MFLNIPTCDTPTYVAGCGLLPLNGVSWLEAQA